MIGAQLGQYRILEQIGSGGMGAVYRAEHVALGRHAAVKVLHNEFSRRPDVVHRFFNEARAATQVADPGIVQIFDFGQHVDGSAYIVMELLDGEPLDKRVRRHGALQLQDALVIARQVASSLGAAHARGIVHRDIKPENIFLARDPAMPGGERAKVLDFGIAKLTQDGNAHQTATSAVIGTPLYMSPEQCRGAGAVDQRSDVYSLGCVLNVMLTGVAPFQGEGTGELIVKHMTAPPPAPSQRVPGIPPEIDALVLCCLEKDPNRRFANGSDLAAAIDQLLAQMYGYGGARPSYPQFQTPLPTPPAAGTHHGPLGAPAATTLSSASGATQPGARVRSARMIAVGAAVVVASAALVIGVLVARDRSKKAGAQPSSAAAAPTAPTTSAVAESPPPTPATPAQPAGPSPEQQNHDAAVAVLKAGLVASKDWMHAHPHGACPTPADLALGNDPWGAALVVTCTDQPADQQVGVTSLGPDRAAGTGDDLNSWALGPEVTQLVRGPRWAPAPEVAGKAVTPIKTTNTTKTTKTTNTTKSTKSTKASNDAFIDTDGDGIPDKR